MLSIQAHAGRWLVSQDGVLLFQSKSSGYWGLRAALRFACEQKGKADAFRWLGESLCQESPDERAGFVKAVKHLLGLEQEEVAHV